MRLNIYIVSAFIVAVKADYKVRSHSCSPNIARL